MKNWFKKLFCRCNNSVEIISNRKGILQFGKCKKCGSYWLINSLDRAIKISEKEYLEDKNNLDRLDNIFKEYEDNEEKD